MSSKMYVVCATETGRAVVVGYSDTEPAVGGPCRLTDARMVLEWRGGAGLFGLAAVGPGPGSRLTAPVPMTSARLVSQVILVTEAAAAAFAAWPVAA